MVPSATQMPRGLVLGCREKAFSRDSRAAALHQVRVPGFGVFSSFKISAMAYKQSEPVMIVTSVRRGLICEQTW